MEIFKIVTLSLSGLLLFFVGISRLTNPIKTFEKSSGIKLQNDGDLLNEIRGVAGVMLTAGLLSIIGAFVIELSFAASFVVATVFIGFAVGRTVSMKVDGKPNPKLIQGLMFELIFGALNVSLLILSLS